MSNKANLSYLTLSCIKRNVTSWMCWVTNVATPLWASIHHSQLFVIKKVWLYFCLVMVRDFQYTVTNLEKKQELKYIFFFNSKSLKKIPLPFSSYFVNFETWVILIILPSWSWMEGMYNKDHKYPDILETFIKSSFMNSYLWNFRVKYSENFENILGKLWGKFSKSIRKFCEKLTKFWVLSSKYLKNSL